MDLGLCIYIYWYVGLGMLVEENSQYVDMSDMGGEGQRERGGRGAEPGMAGMTCRTSE